jgi:hypothetical protein
MTLHRCPVAEFPDRGCDHASSRRSRPQLLRAQHSLRRTIAQTSRTLGNSWQMNPRTHLPATKNGGRRREKVKI